MANEVFLEHSGAEIDDNIDEVVAARGGSASLAAAIAGKQDMLTFDSAPTEESTNPVTSGGVYSAFVGYEVPKTLSFNGSIHDAQPGWWSRVSNLSLVTDTPSDYSGGFICHIINTGLGTPKRKKIFFYPLSAGTEGCFYIQTQLSTGWSSWYKFEGAVVT